MTALSPNEGGNVAEMIPSITLSTFKALKTEQLRRLKCCEVVSDGEYVFSFINGMLEPSGYLRTQSAYGGQNANAVGGETLEQILGEAVPV